MSMTTFLVILGTCLCLNIFATFYIGRAAAYDRSQKQIQITLIWLFPFFASVGLSYFLWCDRKADKHSRKVGNDSNISHSQAIQQASSYYSNR